MLRAQEEALDRLFAKRIEPTQPGAAVGIAIDGEPIYRKGWGVSDIETLHPLDPQTRMRIASISKHITAFCFLLLCEEGRASLDDRVGLYLPHLHPVAQAVTLRQLMGNVSGLRDAHDVLTTFSGFGATALSRDKLQMYEHFADTNHPPGWSYIYNNGGWVIVSAVIEAIAGQRLEEVLSTRVFGPLGMTSTSLERTDQIPHSGLASPHMLDETGAFYCPDAINLFRSEAAGEGGIVSTVDDMLIWLRHMAAPTLGSQATWDVMTAPQILTNGHSTGYGLGLMIGEFGDAKTISHAGGGTGSNAQMTKIIARGLDIIVLCNRSDLSSAVLADEIAEIFEGVAPNQVDCGQRDIPHGVFVSPATGRVVQLPERASMAWVRPLQQAVIIDGMEMAAECDDEAVLHIGHPGDAKQRILFADHPAQLIFDDFGNADRLAPVNTTKSGAEAIAGAYRSDTARADVHIAEQAGEWGMLTRGAFGAADYRLVQLAPGIWRSISRDIAFKSGILVFGRDGFTFSSYSTRRLPFRRLGGGDEASKERDT